MQPCVMAFGGDQFKLPEQAAQLAKFFLLLYFMINFSGLISSMVVPIMREDVQCFGDLSCFPLAFGLPAVLMVLSIFIFTCGRTIYTIRKPSTNMIVLVFKCIGNALSVRTKERTISPRSHWLDYAEPKYGKNIVSDIKSLLKILVLYIPLPVYWALFEQQGSRWTFQATRMDGKVGGYTIKPDQMQMVNPLLIMAFIPVFESCIYPIFAKIGIRRPLQKLSLGGLLAAVSFVMSGFVEIALDRTNAILPAAHESQLRVFNGLPCDYRFDTDIPNLASFTVPSRGAFESLHIDVMTNTTFQFRAETSEIACVRENMTELSGTFYLNPAGAVSYFMSRKGGKINLVEYADKAEKNRNGLPTIRLLANEKTAQEISLRHSKNGDNVYNILLNQYDQLAVIEGEYGVFVGERQIGTVQLSPGGVYTLLLDEVLENEFLPQHIVMPFGEVMFAITGLEFSYSQAPESMKSVIQAFWLLMIAIGNMLVAFIAKAKFVESQSLEYLLFAALMFIDMGLFVILAMRYRYSENTQIDSMEVETNPKKQNNPLTLCETVSETRAKNITYVLCRIFDYLPWKDRQRVSLVCCRWNDIINTDHYMRRQKLVLYNYSKAKFFSGVGVELLNRQKHIELNSNAMLDTEELLQTIGESFGGGEAMVTSLSLFLRSEHRLAFGLVVVNLPNLAHLKELNISANEALRTGVRIESACLEKLYISFYQNSRCTLYTPKLHTLHLTVRYRSEIDLLRSISAQLVELQVSFISKDHVTTLFDCNVSSLKRLSISLRSDKYIVYNVSPVLLRPLDREGVFARTIVGLESLEVVNVCNILDISFLQMFVHARSLKGLIMNYIKLNVEVNQLINGFQLLREVSMLEAIPVRFPALQSYVIENCFLYLIPDDHGKFDMTFDAFRRLMPYCCVSTKDSTIFTAKHCGI
uniref:F-box domain-containing protein n=1 Tax=Anopheles atroparvus TaxID=41427 RepID=A0A182IZF0_ANOAO